MNNNPRSYLNQRLTAGGGYPAGPDLWYECQVCGKAIHSLPADNAACDCRNIIIDVDAGRMAIRDNDQVRMFYGSSN